MSLTEGVMVTVQLGIQTCSQDLIPGRTTIVQLLILVTLVTARVIRSVASVPCYTIVTPVVVW